jgi:MOSC domain-containing protein YiiM
MTSPDRTTQHVRASTGTVTSLNRSNGGVPKSPVAEARVTVDGMEGDRQRDLVHHGGSDRALCLFSADVIHRLRAEGHPIAAGAIGENVTIAGIDWELVHPGVLLAIGEVRVEVTAHTIPCQSIRESFSANRIARVSHHVHPGESRVYARVVTAGSIRVGDRVAVVNDEPPSA